MNFLKSKKLSSFVVFSIVFLAAILVKTIRPEKLSSTELTGVKNTLSSSRISFVGTVGSGNTAGSSVVNIKISDLPAWASSINNKNLFTGDTLMIGDNTNYTFLDVGSTDNELVIYHASGGLQSTDIDDGDPVVATRSAQHTVTFTPVSQINDGYYRIRIKATGVGATQSHDGIPDLDGFDFRSSFQTSWIGCPDTGTPTIEYSGDAHCSSGYTCILCNYSGLNSLAQKTLTIGTTAAAQQPINPAASSTSKTQGVADTYAFYVDHLDSSYNSVDSTQGRIAVVESVRVTATVDPRIELTIAGMTATGASAAGACGVALATTVNTTATTVPFGSISITNFTDAVQQLTVSTNADDGYGVTAIESDQLSLIGATGLTTGTYIADTSCDASNTCSETEDGLWEDASNTKGFGYSLHDPDDDVPSLLFEYDSVTPDYNARRFPATTDGEAAAQIFSSTTVADSQDAYVCYRIVVSGTQEAGTYTNAITYVATATF